MKKLGICDNNGTIIDDVLPAIDVLANARAFTRIYIHNGLNIFEYISYFGADGDVASITNDSGNQLVNYPAPVSTSKIRVKCIFGLPKSSA